MVSRTTLTTSTRPTLRDRTGKHRLAPAPAQPQREPEGRIVTWARLDDLYDDHRKVKRAWRRSPRAVGLHAMALTYSARHETDGLVDAEWLEEKLPSRTERQKVLEVLVDVDLFEHADNGAFRVHDYLDYNPSSAQLADRRRRDAERKATGRAADSNGSPDRVRADTERSPVSLGSARAGPQPGPALPVPTSQSSPRSDQAGESEEREQPPLEPDVEVPPAASDRPDVDRLCGLLAELMLGNNAKARVSPASKGWRDPIRLLLDRDGHDAGHVERVIRWCQADDFWRSNILSPSKLRKQFDQLTLKMQATGVRRAIEGASPASSAQLGAALSRSSRTGAR